MLFISTLFLLQRPTNSLKNKVSQQVGTEISYL